MSGLRFGAAKDANGALGGYIATAFRTLSDLCFHATVSFTVPHVDFQNLLLKFLVRDARAFLNKFEQCLTYQRHLLMSLEQFLAKTLSLVCASSGILRFLLVDANLLGVMCLQKIVYRDRC